MISLADSSSNAIVPTPRREGERMLASTCRVAVTGAAGTVGSFVVRELVAHGYEVVGVDRRAADTPLPARLRAGDLLDQRELPRLLGDCDVIVHLAAHPSPKSAPPQRVLDENVRITRNVLELAEQRRMRRVVLASSESAVGYAWGPSPFQLDYLPLDEAHPLRPVDSYGISKRYSERMAKTVALRSGIPIIALRPPWVLALEWITKHEWRRRFHATPGSHPFNFWSYVDARDLARAFRLALEAPLSGFETFFVAAPDTRHHSPTLDLLRPFFQTSLPPGSDRLNANQSVLSCTKAESLLGWKAERTWRALPGGRMKWLVSRAAGKGREWLSSR